MKMCSTCGEAAREVRSRCRDCYNSYMADYMRKRYHKRRAAALEMLGGACTECGSTDDLVFVYTDPSTQTMDISKALVSKPWKLLEEELKKCTLRCLDCREPRWEHGTLSGVRYCKEECCKAAKRKYMKSYKTAERVWKKMYSQED